MNSTKLCVLLVFVFSLYLSLLVFNVSTMDEREYRGKGRFKNNSRGNGRPPGKKQVVDNSHEDDPSEYKDDSSEDNSEESFEDLNTLKSGTVVTRYPSQLGEEIEELLKSGINIDEGYNEPELDPERLISVPGCPEYYKLFYLIIETNILLDKK